MTIIRFDEISAGSVSKNNTNTIFFHIPKTGGNSFITFLERYYPDYYKAHCVEQWPYIIEKNSMKSETTCAVSGHSCWGIDEHLHMPSIYVTLLRNPVERVLSDFEFRKLRGVINVNTSLDAYLSGMNNNYVNIMGGGDIERAKDFLESGFSVFGFTEHYEEFIKLYGYFFGIPDLEIINSNINKDRKINKVNACNDHLLTVLKDDIELYDYALKLYKKRYSEILSRTAVLPKVEFRFSEESNSKNSREIKEQGQYSSKCLILARENEETGDLAGAEFYYKEFARLVYHGYLLKFYDRNNMPDKKADYLKETCFRLFKYKTENQTSNINRFLANSVRKIIKRYVEENKIDDIGPLLERAVSLADNSLCDPEDIQHILENGSHDNDRIAALIRSLYGRELAGEANVAVFGCGKAGEIAYHICVSMGLKVDFFVDDYKAGGEKFGLPVYEFDKYAESGLKLCIGPFQKLEDREKYIKSRAVFFYG